MGLAPEFRQAWISSTRDLRWTISCVTTIAIGAAFSVCALTLLDRIEFRPYSFPDDARLAIASTAAVAPTTGRAAIDREPWYVKAATVEDAEPYALGPVLVGSGIDQRRITAAYVSSTLDTFLGLRLPQGRWLSNSEVIEGSARTVIVTDRATSGSADESLGSTILLDGIPHTIVGVAPEALVASLVFGRADVFLAFRADAPAVSPALLASSPALLRLRPGVTPREAERDLNRLAPMLAPTGPQALRVGHPGEFMPHEMREAVWMFGVTAALVLLASCTNLVGLVMARLIPRRRELAIRSALGATERHLRRQLSIEAGLVTIGGAVLGIGLGQWLLIVARQVRPDKLSALDHTAVGWLAGLVTLVVMSVVALLALHAALGSSWSSGFGRPVRTERAQRHLVAAQVAFATCLTGVACLLVLGFLATARTPLGFAPDRLLLASVRLPEQAEDSAPVLERVTAFSEEAFATLASAPFFAYRIESTLPELEDGGGFRVPVTVATNTVTANFFSVSAIPFVAGRGFVSGEKDALVISASLASALGIEPEHLGSRLRMYPGTAYRTVVGIVADVAAVPLESGSQPRQMYSLMDSISPNRSVWWIGPQSTRSRLESALADQQLVLEQLVSGDDLVNGALANTRFQTLAIIAIGAFVVLLAMVGEAILLIQYLRSRADELAIRSALGATAAAIGHHVVTRTLMPAAVGVLVGALAAAWLGALARTLVGNTASVWLAVFSGTTLVVLLTLGLTALLLLASTYIKPDRALRSGPVT